ncbi:hypothetical protein [Aquimarina aggregata]|uniref:hypothetical protein n=1 Tax=Aquimarina aggregata TaxID=1642818 RepID=UPI0024906063|nr:hypothetical protein [Aquimarina aggregata]
MDFTCFTAFIEAIFDQIKKRIALIYSHITKITFYDTSTAQHHYIPYRIFNESLYDDLLANS